MTRIDCLKAILAFICMIFFTDKARVRFLKDVRSETLKKISCSGG